MHSHALYCLWCSLQFDFIEYTVGPTVVPNWPQTCHLPTGQIRRFLPGEVLTVFYSIQLNSTPPYRIFRFITNHTWGSTGLITKLHGPVAQCITVQDALIFNDEMIRQSLSAKVCLQKFYMGMMLTHSLSLTPTSHLPLERFNKSMSLSFFLCSLTVMQLFLVVSVNFIKGTFCSN